MTKAEAILREIARELATRDIDAADLRKISIVVMIRQGVGTPHAVLSNLEYGRDVDYAPKRKLADSANASVP